MKWIKISLIAAVGVVGGSGASARQDEYACRLAVSSYNSAVDDIATQMQRYGRCVSYSEGEDDCYLEFSRLRRAQGDFESAVSRYSLSCD